MVLDSVFAVVIRLTPVFRNKKSQHTLTLYWQMWLAAIYLSSSPFASLLPEALSIMGEALTDFLVPF